MRSILVALFLIASPLRAVTPVATIISYHQIVPPGAKSDTANGETPTYTITTEQFDAQMDYLQQNGYHVIALASLVACIKGDLSSLPAKSVVISVDDGWQSVYSIMYPDLQKRQMPFTAFIFPAEISLGKDYLTWPEVEEMAKAGVDIESHSFTHSYLTKPDAMTPDAYAQFLQHELQDSRTVIEQHTQKPVRFFVPPYSVYDDAVIEAVSAAGYEAMLYDRAYADPVKHGEYITLNTPLLHLKRFPIETDTTLDKFKTFLLP